MNFREKPSRYIMHIGRHKTGTSSLQSNLSATAHQLKAQGLIYPTAGRNGGDAHHPLAHALGAKVPTESECSREELEAFEQALKQAEDANDILVSSEAFQQIDPMKTTRWFQPEKMLVIVYLREQYVYLQSAYCQSIKAQTSTLTFSEYIETAWKPPNYSWFLNRWEKLNSELSVGIYSRDQLRDNDIFSDFCHRIDIEKPNAPEQTRNPSIGGPLLAFKRELNRLPVDANKLRLQLTPLLVYLAKQHTDYTTKPFLSDAQIAEIRARVQDTNVEVAERFFGTSNLFGSFPTEQNQNANESSPEATPLTLPEIELLFARINAAPDGAKTLHWLHELVQSLNAHEQKELVGSWYQELPNYLKSI